MLTVNLPQGECDFLIDWHIEQLYLKVTLPLCNICVKSTLDGVESVQWANQHIPCVKCLQ